MEDPELSSITARKEGLRDTDKNLDMPINSLAFEMSVCEAMASKRGIRSKREPHCNQGQRHAEGKKQCEGSAAIQSTLMQSKGLPRSGL
jgi:hypothetical protein